jgi:hypothetical protein
MRLIWATIFLPRSPKIEKQERTAAQPGGTSFPTGSTVIALAAKYGRHDIHR